MFGLDINAKQVTQEELAKILIDLDKKGMVPVSVTTVTKQRTRKPDGYEKFVLEGYAGKGGETYFSKVSQINGNIGIDYTAAVNREREKAGLDADFVAKKSPYEFVTKGVRKKGDQYYLFYYPRSAAADFEPIITGKPISESIQVVDVEDIADWMPVKKEKGPGRQGLDPDKEVQPQSLSFASIAAIRVDGQSYVVSDIDDNRLESFEIAFTE